jgi:hypothetical protein
MMRVWNDGKVLLFSLHQSGPNKNVGAKLIAHVVNGRFEAQGKREVHPKDGRAIHIRVRFLYCGSELLRSIGYF